MHNKIRNLRKKKGFTMKKLADAVGTSQQQIDRLEKNQRRLTVDWMRRIGKALDCDIMDLLPDSGQHRSSAITSKAKVVGKVQSNLNIEWLTPEETYPLLFGRPKFVPSTRMFALIVNGADNSDFPEGTELVFSELDNEKEIVSEQGKTVICAYKNGENSTTYSIETTPLNDNEKKIKALLVKSIRNE